MTGHSDTLNRLESISRLDDLTRRRYDLGPGRSLSEFALQNLGSIDNSASMITQKIRALDNERKHGDEQRYRALGMKGVSVTLGYVEQNGNWDAVKPLDEAFRTFANSHDLEDQGFSMEETYDDKTNSRLTYDFAFVSNASVEGFNFSFTGIRKRAAADITAPDGAKIEIVKRSSFLIDYNKISQLPRCQRALVRTVMRTLRDDKAPVKDDSDLLGLEIIEPYIEQPETRIDAPALPASTTYFGLHRFN